MFSALAHLSNHALIDRVKHLAECERKATTSLIAHLSELDERRLYLAEALGQAWPDETALVRIEPTIEVMHGHSVARLYH